MATLESLKTRTFDEIKAACPDLTNSEVAAMWGLEGHVYWVLRYERLKELLVIYKTALPSLWHDPAQTLELILDYIEPVEKEIKLIEENNHATLANA